MRRDAGIVRGLVQWLTGGLSARLEILERDVDSLQGETRKISNEQNGMTRVLADHHQRLNDQAAQLRTQTDQMIALRRMHAALSERLGEPFPGKACAECGAALVFSRQASKKAYALTCSAGCKEQLLLPEASLLETFSLSRSNVS